MQHFAILRMHRSCNHRLVPPGHAHGHQHRFRRARGTVVHAGVGHIHAGQFGNHGLEFEDGLQRSLRDLRLIRRIAGQKFAALHQRVNDHRAIVAIAARAQKAGIVGGILFAAALK